MDAVIDQSIDWDPDNMYLWETRNELFIFLANKEVPHDFHKCEWMVGRELPLESCCKKRKFIFLSLPYPVDIMVQKTEMFKYLINVGRAMHC